jgi:hypothetical protein
MRCPNMIGNIECKGLVDQSWKCNLCNISICDKCLTKYKAKVTTRSKSPKSLKHKCKKEDIDTANLLNNSTRTCPLCLTRIEKKDGCDAMWCTECHISFSWTTKEVVKSTHNPELADHNIHSRADHQHSNGKNECFDITTFTDDYSDIDVMFFYVADWLRELKYYCDNSKIRDLLEDLRVDYIMGLISEEKYADEIIKTERRDKMLRTEIEILDTYIIIMMDQFNAYFSRKKNISLMRTKKGGPIDVKKKIKLYRIEFDDMLITSTEITKIFCDYLIDELGPNIKPLIMGKHYKGIMGDIPATYHLLT